MKINLKTTGLLACMLLSGSLFPAAAQEEKPIITFHTTVYENTQEENAFHIVIGATENTYIDIDYGFGLEEQEVGQAIFDSESQSVKGTWINGSVSKEGIVKIYGDPKLIDYLDMEGCYIDEISFPELTELQVLNLSNNSIGELDLSHMTKLQALYLSSNPFDKRPLIIGGDKPDLTILEISIIDNLDPEFDITGYPNLLSFDAWHVYSLTHIDPTNCPNLLRLSIDSTSVSSLDVSKNPNLLILNIGQTRITSIDLSNNNNLTEFYCTNNGSSNQFGGLSTIDLSNMANLIRLSLGFNYLNSIDLSHNPKLQDVQLRNNYLTALDISANPDLMNLDLTENNISFANLPANRDTFIDYYYAQRDLEMNKSYAAGSVIDFSEAVIRPNSETTATLYAYNRSNPNDPVELGEEYFSFDNGKVTLHKEYADSLYLSFRNSALPLYPRQTHLFKVQSAENFGKDHAEVTVNFSSLQKNLVMSVGIIGATPESPKTFGVDFGDGKVKTFTATGSGFPKEPNVTGTRAGATTTFYLHEGDLMTAFGISAGRVTDIDLSRAEAIGDLRITGVRLASIDLQWNSTLSYLDLSHNTLSTLDLSGANGRYEKNLLSTIILNDNSLTEIIQPQRTPTLMIDVSDNLFSEYELTKYNNLKWLNMSGNELTAVNLQDMEALEWLDLSRNAITELALPDYVPLKHFDITLNNITFGNLPPVGIAEEYLYAPQQPVLLPAKAPTANLSSEYFVDDKGGVTAYNWYTVEGHKAISSDEITGNQGRFKFINPDLGLLVCEMSHPAFPDFTGENILKSTEIMTAPMPTHVFASMKTKSSQEAFITLAGKTAGTTVYIDWTGNGDLDQYVLATTYRVYPVKTFADTEVKCYSYDEEDEVTVFSIRGIELDYMDASPMTDVFTFSCCAGLSDGQLILPQNGGLQELSIEENNFTKLPDLTGHPNLWMLSIGYNPLGTLDLSPYKNLRNLYAASCGLTEVKFDNPLLADLVLSTNELEHLDFSATPLLNQAYLSYNKLSEIDVEGLERLKVLYIDNNLFTIANLPLPNDQYNIYNYSNQAQLEATVVDGTVDLSSLAERDGVKSIYRWYLDSPYFNEEGELLGEELYEGEEYTIENGVTTFLDSFRNLVCVVTNPLFPQLYLYTGFLDVEAAAVDSIEIDSDAKAVYYNLQGMKVENPGSGIYVKVAGGKASKVLIRR